VVYPSRPVEVILFQNGRAVHVLCFASDIPGECTLFISKLASSLVNVFEYFGGGH